MGLDYRNQITYQLLGTKVIKPAVKGSDASFVITPVALTAAYSGNVSSAALSKDSSQHVFNVQYKAGTNATELDLKIEYSGDTAFTTNVPVNWFQETSEAVGVGTTVEYLQTRRFTNNSSLVAGTTYNFRITVPVADMFVRISAQEALSGGTAFGTIYVELINSGR